MKKIFIYLLIVSPLIFMACDAEETGGVNLVTNYAVLETLGDPIIFVEIGSAYTEPGVSATISGEAVEFETIGSVDAGTPGIYDLQYLVVNSDGFPATSNRIVYVYENDGSVAGVYDGLRVGRAGGPILVTTTGTAGTYSISDILGGHYEFERGFGRGAGAAPSTITVTGSSITSPGGNNTFGLWLMSAGSLSGDEKTMTWTSTIPAFAFGYDVELTKVTP